MTKNLESKLDLSSIPSSEQIPQEMKNPLMYSWKRCLSTKRMAYISGMRFEQFSALKKTGNLRYY